MLKEGHEKIKSGQFGALAFLRKKQWWSFEGLDPTPQVYFLVLALNSVYASYISLKIINYKTGKVYTNDFFGKLIIDDQKNLVISYKGKGGKIHIQGSPVIVDMKKGLETEKWNIMVDSPEVSLKMEQTPKADDPHYTNILTKRLNYHINQYIMNDCEGELVTRFKGDKETKISFNGFGYCEHCWGVQPRQSTAHWMHFWSKDIAGVVMNCYYDEGTPHHYTYFWLPPHEEFYLHSPAQFRFDPRDLDKTWEIKSPDLELQIKPLYKETNRMRIPPVFSYVKIDYFELLVEVKGTATIKGKDYEVDGIGKYDHNFNFW